TAESDQAYAKFGFSVASAGDVNGDGYDDVVVGSFAHSNGELSEGRAFVYLGSAAGLSATPAWTAESDQAFAQFGRSVTSAGDVNGDGFDDVVVGAPYYDGGQTDEGSVYLYLGSAAGLSPTPAWSVESDQADSFFGGAVASAGDVNGDGYDDVVVGAFDYDDGQTGEGAAFVYLGSAAGLESAPARTLEVDQTEAAFGWSVASAGDLNGDGYDEVVVGARYHDHGETNEGGAFVYVGSAAGLSASPAWTVESDQAYAVLGWSVASAGDVNGDGWDDWVAGAIGYTNGQTDEGAVFAYHGVGLPDGDGDGFPDPADLCPQVPDVQLDTDGDGRGNACDDPRLSVGVVTSTGPVTLRASGAAPGERVWFAGSEGAGSGPCPAPLGGLCLDLGPNSGVLGSAIADGAGRAAFSVPVPAVVQPFGDYRVQAFIARGVGGSTSVVSDVVRVDASTMDWDGDGLVDADELSLGTDPSSPDTDGDGLLDGDELPLFDPLDPDGDGDGILDGADICWAGDDRVEGDGDGVPDACDVCPTVFDPAQRDSDADGRGDGCQVLLGPVWTAESTIGESIWFGSAKSAGDVNGDGYDDVLVTMPSYSNGQPAEGVALLYLGSSTGLSSVPSWRVETNQAFAPISASPAGDVNGDGYDDVVLGQPDYHRGEWMEGKVSLYLGSAAGLSAVPSWDLESNLVNARLGWSASAGDVNGDGYDDVVMGATGYDNGRGAALLYLGSATGLAATAAWTATSNQVNAHFGSVQPAGDVNGDGYDDVVVGAIGYQNGQTEEGALFLYLGSAAGLSVAPAWTVESDQENAWMGFGTAAGDVNGDGYGDLVVGVPSYDHGEDDEGVAMVYLGSASGLSSVPAWAVESNLAGANYGMSVASAGDVNGDGYDDVVVGSPTYLTVPGYFTDYYGAAFVYLGSATGLSVDPAWSVVSGEDLDDFGFSVASAGDVNGDGASDVVIGAPYADAGGTALLYLGNFVP
ncbi:MAG: FG-GAP repeat protein, partial [Microthrixaceae bacterium]|nr:FG-GAP repeat protein [Microthrixaceae bacterium]